MSALNLIIKLLSNYTEINAEQKCKIYIFETFMNFSNQNIILDKFLPKRVIFNRSLIGILKIMMIDERSMASKPIND